jgi:transcriptional regulator with XRE-family HTH domain
VTKQERFQKQIGARVRELRTAKNISQEAFADLCSLHRTHMSLVERGRVNLTMQTFKTILDALEIKPSDFFLAMERPDNSLK